MKIFLAATLFVLTLCGCVSSPPVSQVNNYKKIGVVSLVGERLTRKHVGFMVFGNELEVVDVSEWKLDDAFAKVVASSLRERTSLDVVVVPASDALRSMFGSEAAIVARERFVDFASQSQENSAATGEKVNWWTQSQAKLAKEVADANVDALVILAPDMLEDPFYPTNQYVTGLGIYTRRDNDKQGQSVLHIVAMLAVVGKAGTAVGGGLLMVKVPPGIGYRSYSPLSIRIPIAQARKPVAAMTPGEREKLRELYLTIPLKSTVDRAIAGLFPATPTEGRPRQNAP